jgi:Fic family protein
MVWNWQQPDWPNFSWDRGRLATAEQAFLVGGGMLVGTVKHLGTDEHDQLTIEAMSTEAVTTSEIEGKTLDRASVQSSIRKQLGLSTDNRRVSSAEQGIAEMMVDLYRSFGEPLSDETLFRWHRMVVSGSRDLRDVGRFRSGDGPMQVVSGAIYEPKVHFEAPPSSQVAPEMARFVDWFDRTAPRGEEPLSALTRVGIAHLYFESVPVRGWKRANWPGDSREMLGTDLGTTDANRLGGDHVLPGARAITTRSKRPTSTTKSLPGWRGLPV